MPELQSIYKCPNRATETCAGMISDCTNERLSLHGELHPIGLLAEQSVMDGYSDFESRHQGWANQDTIRSLRVVFEAVGRARYNSVNPKTNIQCKGRSLILNSCTAQAVEA